MTLKYLASIIMRWLAVGVLAFGANAGSAAEWFSNPLLDSGADPWVTRDGKFYYYTQTLGNRIEMA